jgi:anthranilate phosphoribosyltransferase
MDELTLTGPSYVAALDGGKIKTFEVTPEEAGLGRAKPEDLKGGDGAANALRIRSMFTGERGPLRDVVLYNAAAALLVAGKAKDLKDGVGLAASAIDRGKAGAALDKLVAITNSPAPEMAGAAAS